MILVKRNIAVLLYAFFTAAILAVGVYGFIALGGGAPEQSTDLKTMGERILFISITGAAVILVVFIAIAWRTKSLYRELDKLIELNKRGDFSPELSMKKLGSVGERITQLYFSLNTLNERKTLKISALSSLADFFVGNIDVPLIATDVEGHILYASRSFIESSEKSRSELINRSADQIFPDVPFRDSVVELDRRNAPLEVQKVENPLTLLGIRNRRNELAYVVWLFDGAVRLPQEVSVKRRPGAGNKRLRNVFKRRKT